MQDAGRNIGVPATGRNGADWRTYDTKLFRQFRRNRGRRSAGVDGELEWAPAICVNVDQNERLGRAGQTHRNFGDRLRPACQLEPFWILEANLALAIVERNPEMLEEIVAQVAVDLCAHRLANLTQIDNTHIYIVQLHGSHGE